MNAIMHPIVRVFEHVRLHSGDGDCMEGNLLDWANLQGALGDAPICNDTSSNRSWVASSGSPPENDRVGEVSLCTLLPAFVAFFHLPIL